MMKDAEVLTAFSLMTFSFHVLSNVKIFLSRVTSLVLSGRDTSPSSSTPRGPTNLCSRV